MTLQFYNTLTRRKEEFRPITSQNVRMYVCGPTVYDRAHLGNARSVVVYDVLYRLLCHIFGRESVTYVRNITDVDDKINAAAKERRITIQALTKEVTGWFHADMDDLHVLRPNQEPKATEHIPQMVSMIEKLIANGNAYVAQGHVLFSVKTDPHYGRLSGRVQEDLRAGARVEVESYKQDAGDFVLWKPANAGDDPSSVFDSPWGKGRPGWHIECSAMSVEYLGETFDLHGGGSDLMFPHHENEIAQSCCANPQSQFAKYWVHNGFLTVNGEKMSKSLGNFITVRDLLNSGVRAEVIRWALLSTRYSEPLDWNEKLVSDAKKELDGFYRTLGDAVLLLDIHAPGWEDASVKDTSFIAPLMDDLNMAPYKSSLMQLFGNIRKMRNDLLYEKQIPKAPLDALTELVMQAKKACELVGILQISPKEWFKGDVVVEASAIDIIQKIKDRINAKKERNWVEADRIRKELSDQGILLEDKPDGTTDWRKA